MKKIAALFLVIISLSCDNESTVQPQTNTVIPIVNDYWPTEIGNEWHYNNSINPNGSPFQLYTIVGTETINGNLYHKFYPQIDQNPDYIIGPFSYLRKNNGDYFYKTGETLIFDTNGTTTYGGNEIIILKDYLNINETWSGSFTYFDSLNGQVIETYNATYIGEILDSNVTELINGVTYNNIIKTKITTITTRSSGTTTKIIEYWFAKDIGIVKQIYNNSTSHNITSYLLN